MKLSRLTMPSGTYFLMFLLLYKLSSIFANSPRANQIYFPVKMDYRIIFCVIFPKILIVIATIGYLPADFFPQFPSCVSAVAWIFIVALPCLLSVWANPIRYIFPIHS